MFANTAQGDYTRVQSSSVTFSPTETEQFVDVVIMDDRLLEDSEDFFGVLSLQPGSIGVSLGVDRTTVTIQDNDGKKYNLSWLLRS